MNKELNTGGNLDVGTELEAALKQEIYSKQEMDKNSLIKGYDKLNDRRKKLKKRVNQLESQMKLPVDDRDVVLLSSENITTRIQRYVYSQKWLPMGFPSLQSTQEVPTSGEQNKEIKECIQRHKTNIKEINQELELYREDLRGFFGN